MDKNDFLRHQYLTLREEIRDSKDRIFKIIAFGLLSAPATHFLAITYNIDIILYAIPALIIIIALAYLAENHALMRAGAYIKLHIEPKVDICCGWERWLACSNEYDSRTVDRFLTYSFFLLFSVYYIGASILAGQRLLANESIVVFAIATGTYVSLGFWFEIFLWNNLKTDTAQEPMRCKHDCLNKTINASSPPTSREHPSA